MKIKQAVVVTTTSAAGILGATGVASADQVTVKAGDTLASIAQETGSSMDVLASINNIQDQNMIFVGEVLQTTGNASANQAPVAQASVAQATATVSPVSVDDISAQVAAAPTQAPASSGSTYDQFIANGGTAAMWNTIVMPESEGNPNAVSPNGYRGLGQTKEGWGTGSVAEQTQGMINYANSRYGSIDGALAFRDANGWW
ncbi:LysM peptidoglycan-binding domain-containing protein [Weissella minor]|uniref:M23 family metallopeptidase n=1 Tax=Weissella minor TaxID=1620 RepID=UPI001BAFAFBC|nr:LysM peptidoglycan-binding domain-containing protein [Weissella minor]MBS0950520.1 LysM peptidoglycan-binding domain-containing protein [Weissella minor]